jgi:hypothetical protein
MPGWFNGGHRVNSVTSQKHDDDNSGVVLAASSHKNLFVILIQHVFHSILVATFSIDVVGLVITFGSPSCNTRSIAMNRQEK